MLLSRSKFFKTTKLHKPAGQVQPEVFEKFTFVKCLLHQTTLKIMLLLNHNLHEKDITESQDRRNFGTIYMLSVLIWTCVNFALMLHDKCTCFQQIRHIIFSCILFLLSLLLLLKIFITIRIKFQEQLPINFCIFVLDEMHPYQ